MAVVNFYRTAPKSDGGFAPAAGFIKFTQTGRRRIAGSPDNTVLDLPFSVTFVNGLVAPDLAATGVDWVWLVEEHVKGLPVKTYAVTVPSGAGPFDDADLTVVDPRDFTPIPGATSVAGATDTAVAGFVNNSASGTRTALNAAYAGLQSDRGREYLQTKRTIALREWFRSLGARNTAPANWMGIGDSISERKSCTKFRNAYQNVAQGILRTNIPTTGAAGGDGYVPAILSYATSVLTDWPYSYSGSGWVRDTTKGLGFVASNLSPGGVITLNVPAGHTAVDIFYGKTGGSPGTRALTVALDGGAGTVIDTVGSTLDFIPYRVTLPNSNAHTITVTGSGSSAAAIFDGAYLYNGDESKGIRAWVNGQSSLPAKTITANYLAILGNQVAQVQPSLFTIELGANDYQNGTPTTAATFKTNIQSIISTIRANCTRPPSIVLMVPWTWTPGVTPVETGGWAAFVAALYEIAAADDDICIFDMQQRVTLATTSDATTKARGLLGSDSIHPSDEGAWMIGYALARFLTP